MVSPINLFLIGLQGMIKLQNNHLSMRRRHRSGSCRLSFLIRKISAFGEEPGLNIPNGVRVSELAKEL